MSQRSSLLHPAIIIAFVVVSAVAVLAVVTRDHAESGQPQQEGARKAERPQRNAIYQPLSKLKAGTWWLGPNRRDVRAYADRGYQGKRAITYIHNYRNQATQLQRGKLAKDTVTVITENVTASQARRIRASLPRGRRLATSAGAQAYVDPSLTTARIFTDTGQLITIYSASVERLRPSLLALQRAK